MAGLRRMLALTALPSFDNAWPSSSDAWPISKAGRRERDRILDAAAAEGTDGADGTALLRAAVLRQMEEEDAGFAAGVRAYRDHPWRRDMPEPPTLWSEGCVRVLDFGGQGRPVLFVPSLINRAYVLDLAPGASMLRYLAEEGVRPLLLDWGTPGPAERGFTLTDHIAGPLERALAALPGPVVLAGYCMGGLLTLAAALRQPERVAALALLATPWNFHAGPDAPARGRSLAKLLPALEPAMELAGALPTEMVQALFAALDPWGIARKFRRFGKERPDTDRARLFVALEDWLNDGVPLAAPVARSCFQDWYGRNDTARLAWRVAGAVVDPADWAGPLFVAVPRADRIVPPASALALALRAGQGRASMTLHEAGAGHIGMVAGPMARSALWRPLLGWLRSLP